MVDHDILNSLPSNPSEYLKMLVKEKSGCIFTRLAHMSTKYEGSGQIFDDTIDYWMYTNWEWFKEYCEVISAHDIIAIEIISNHSGGTDGWRFFPEDEHFKLFKGEVNK